LTDFGTADANARANLGQLQTRLRRQSHLTAASKAGTVKEQREPDSAIGTGQRLPSSLEIGAFDGLAKRGQRTAVAAETLSSRCGIAGPQSIHFADSYRIDAKSARDAIHMDFRRELRLRRAEPTEGTVRRCVGHRRSSADADVIAPVGSARVDHAARQHDRAQSRVRTSIEDGVDGDRGEPALASDTSPMSDDCGVPLGGREHVLDTVVDELHRASRLQREQRGVPGNDRRILFLTAKSTARLRLHDSDFVIL
jgi:hypothetical protein